MVEAPVEEWLIAEHTHHGRTGALVDARSLGDAEGTREHAGGRRAQLDLGDQLERLAGATLQIDWDERSWRRQSTGAQPSELLSLALQNAIQKVGHGLLASLARTQASSLERAVPSSTVFLARASPSRGESP